MKSVYRSEKGKKIIQDLYNEILKKWPQPYDTYTVPTEFGNTFVIAHGPESADAVVLLHGSTTNSAMWIADAAVLGTTRRVYAVDLIGEPGKSDESRPKMAHANYARWMEQVLDRLGVRKAAFVGNSLGGWIALDLAIHSPERVSALTLLAAAGIAPVRRLYVFKVISLIALGRKGMDKLYHLMFGKAHIPKKVIEYADILARYYIPRPLNAPVFSDDAFKRLNMPVLYVGGEHDALLNTPKSVKRLKALVPPADVRVAAGMSHTLINMGKDIKAFLDAQEA